MRIQFFGATRTTTGSMYLIEVNGRKVLLECGLFQGRRAESVERNRNFPFDPKQLDAVIISHAHLDHCGNLPGLCREGFEGNIYATFATRDLASILLEDFAEIQRNDAAYVSQMRTKQGQPLVGPLFTAADAEKAVRQFVAVNYDRPFPIADGVTVAFRDAGHILGSAQVVFDVRENRQAFRLLFSGDVGRGDDDILRSPERVNDVDYLLIESTYGGRDHAPKMQANAEVGRLVRQTLDRRGKVIIPAFSVGRAQQIVSALHQLALAGQLPRVPIVVDSPLSASAAGIYRLHPECFNPSVYKFLREKENPFGMDNVTCVREPAQSMKLNDYADPVIIISPSGMAESGRIRHHLKHHISDPKNLVLLAGHCAADTLGAQLLARRSPVSIFGELYEIGAQVASMDALSGHADRNELRRYVEAITGDLKKIGVVHGEESQSLALADVLCQLRPDAQVFVPEYRQVLDF